MIKTPRVHQTQSVKSLCIANQEFVVLDIELDISKGFFRFNIVGLPDKNILESRIRILSAIKNSGLKTPQQLNQKLTVSLSPATLKKKGAGVEMAIIFAYLLATQQVEYTYKVPDYPICFLGNVNLNGIVYSNTADISHLIYAGYNKNITHFVIPQCDLRYLNFKGAEDIYICKIQCVSDLKTDLKFEKHTPKIHFVSNQTNNSFYIDQLKGIESQKRAIMIALAGDHPMLLKGPPGTGKTALVHAATELIDDLNPDEILKYISMQHIYDANDSITPTSNKTHDLKRPIETPHHQYTLFNMYGNQKRPFGSIQKSYFGILILDELAEYQKHVIEILRKRLDSTNQYSGLVLATTNLCPCGRRQANTQNKTQICTCTHAQIKKYREKISEPVLDRFHLIINLEYQDSILTTNTDKYKGSFMKETIKVTRRAQYIRNGNTYNSQLSLKQISDLGFHPNTEGVLKDITETFTLSKRKLLHTYRLARTIADIDSKKHIEQKHLYEAIQYVRGGLDF